MELHVVVVVIIIVLFSLWLLLMLYVVLFSFYECLSSASIKSNMNKTRSS